MKKYCLSLLIFYCCSCNNNRNIISRSESYRIDTSGIGPIDSLKYVFDTKDGDSYIYHIQYLKYRKVGGLAIYQGDIQIASNIHQYSGLDTSLIGKSDTVISLIGLPISSSERLWPDRTVRYMISPYGKTSGIKSNIEAAIDAWRAVGLKFVEISSDAGDYILFQSLGDYEFNSSALGRQKGSQEIRLTADANVGNIIHEIGHALGLWHEQSRPDRNRFIDIIYDNIQPGYTSEFDPIQEDFSYFNTSYDYESIMHYGEHAFAKKDDEGNDLVTMRSKPPGKSFGQRDQLSTSDIKGIKKLYNL